MIKLLLKKTLVNTAIYGVGNALMGFYQLLLLPILSKNLSTPNWAKYLLYTSVINILVTVVIFGMDNATVRFFYDKETIEHKKSVFSSGFFVILMAALMMFLLFCIYYYFAHVGYINNPDIFHKSFIYAILSIPFLALLRYFQNWLKWTLKPVKFLMLTLSFFISQILLVLYLSYANLLDIENVMLVNLSSTILSCTLGLFFCGKSITKQVKIDFFKNIIKYGIPFLLVGFASGFRSNGDRILLNTFLKSDEILASYGFIQRISMILSVITMAIDVAIGPIIFSTWDKENAKETYARIQTYLCFILSLLNVLFIIISPFIITFLGKPEFLNASKILPLLSLSNVVFALFSFAFIGISYAKNSWLNLLAALTSFVLLFAFSYFLIPYFLMVGAALATLISTVGMLIVGYFLSSKYYKINFNYLKDIFLLFTGFLISTLLVQFYNNVLPSLTTVLILIISTLLLYFIAGRIFFNREFKLFLNKLNL